MPYLIASAIQDKALSGKETSITPTGLFKSSIGSVSFSTLKYPTWAETISFWSNVRGDPALSILRDQFAWAFSLISASYPIEKSKVTGSGTFVLDTTWRLRDSQFVSRICVQV